MTNKKFAYLSLALQLKHLRAIGFYQLDPKSSKKHKYYHRIYMIFIFSMIMMYATQHIMKIYELSDNPDRVKDSLFFLLTQTDCIYKLLILWAKADQVEQILNVVKGNVFNQNKPEHRKILMETIQQARWFLYTFNAMALCTCVLWALFPIIQYVQGFDMELQIWLPFDAYVNPLFFFVMVYVWIQSSIFGFSNTTIDAFISYIFAQCKAQLVILRIDLESLVENSMIEARDDVESYSEILRIRLGKIIKHHNEIIKLIDKVQEVFGGAVLYQILVSCWIICTTAYRTVNMNVASIEFLSMILYMLCIITELFVYCFFGNEVTSESNKLIESAYCMDWLNLPVRQRKDLIMFMERIKRPITIVSGIVIPLSASTFATILKTSYTFYAFLKNSG